MFFFHSGLRQKTSFLPPHFHIGNSNPFHCGANTTRYWRPTRRGVRKSNSCSSEYGALRYIHLAAKPVMERHSAIFLMPWNPHGH
jgi:hypothetical protein